MIDLVQSPARAPVDFVENNPADRPRLPDRKAVIYITNENFLYPTLVSAFQVERQIDPERMDIVIFLSEVSQEARDFACEFARGRHIRFQTLDSALFATADGIEILPSHVPITSLARLVVEQVLDPVYDDILYVDGDTLITGDIQPLLAFTPAPGWIGAVRGSIWLSRRGGYATSMNADAYVRGLELNYPDLYFNAGILSIRREDLRRLGRAAFEYVGRFPNRCRFLDQSALNHVFDGKVTELWPGYNYHMPYQQLLPAPSVRPSIVHFTGPVKPWVHRSGPLAEFALIYDRFDAEHPSLAPFRAKADARIEAIVRSRFNRERVKRWLFPVRWIRGRGLLRRYLSSFDAAAGSIALDALESRPLYAKVSHRTENLKRSVDSRAHGTPAATSGEL